MEYRIVQFYIMAAIQQYLYHQFCWTDSKTFAWLTDDLSGLRLCLMNYDPEYQKNLKSGGSARLIASYKTYDIFEFELEKCEVVESEHWG